MFILTYYDREPVEIQASLVGPFLKSTFCFSVFIRPNGVGVEDSKRVSIDASSSILETVSLVVDRLNITVPLLLLLAGYIKET